MQTDRDRLKDSGSSRRPRPTPLRGSWWGRCVTGAVLAAVLAAPGVAYAAEPASPAASPRAVAADMVAGATEFAGTRPQCRTIVTGANYRCTISGGAPYYDLPSLTHAQQLLLTLAPPGPTPGSHPQVSLAADRVYQEQLLQSWGWTAAQAREYASGNVPDIFAGDFAGINEPTVNAVTHRINGGCVSLDSTGSRWDCYLGQAAVRAGEASPRLLGEKVSGPLAK